MTSERKTHEFERIFGSNPYGNQLKLFWHFRRMCEFFKTGSTFPIQVELNATNYCNMACRWCLTEYSHNNEFLPINLLERFFIEFHALGGKSIDWTGGGEPTAYPHFKRAVCKAAEAGLRQGLMTNGLFKPELITTLINNFTWIRISLDSSNAEKYGKMKGVNEKAVGLVMNNIRELCRYSERPRIVVNINLSDWNYPDLEKTILDAKECGVDGLQIRPVLPQPGKVYTRKETRFFQRFLREISRYKVHDSREFQVFLSNDKFSDVISGNVYERCYDKCQYHQFIIVLNANGDLCVCTHHLGDERFTFGNIRNTSLEKIWEGTKRQKVLEFCDNLDFADCQVCCKGHELNKLLHFIQNPNPKSDPDFF
jgi:radical SAM protein with 4Fe4S-binding SPASM domain